MGDTFGAVTEVRLQVTHVRSLKIDAFNEFGVAITTPACEGDPEHPEHLPKDRWCEESARR